MAIDISCLKMKQTAQQRVMFDLRVNSAKGISEKTRLMLRGEVIGNVHQVVRQQQASILRSGNSS